MPITMFRLIDKKVDPNSQFRNEDGTIDPDKKVDFNNRYGVLNPYFIIKKGGVREHRRYIKGCSFFEIDRQNKEGYSFDINTGIVEFKAGGDIYVDDEEDAALIQWLKDHPNNVDSIYHNEDKHDKQFITHDPQKNVLKEIETATEEDEAIGLVIKLKDNPAKLRAIANIFKETSGMTDENSIYLELRRLAKEKPGVFNSSIADKQMSVLGDVRLARKYNIITRDAKAFIYEGTEGIIFPTVEKNDNRADESLAQFLMSREGHDHYKQIQITIAQKEIALNAPVGDNEPDPPKE
jgi:hypothetical protein